MVVTPCHTGNYDDHRGQPREQIKVSFLVAMNRVCPWVPVGDHRIFAHVYPLVVAAQHPAPLGALIKSCTESITESIVESVTEYFLLGARHVLRCHHGAS